MVAALARHIKSSMVWDPEQHRQYTSIFHVITDNKSDGPITAVEAPGIPAYRSSYQWPPAALATPVDVDAWAFANKATANVIDEKETARLWAVAVEYSTRPATRCGDFKIENPLNEPLRISGSFIQFTRPATEDNDGHAITNTVDEPFVPLVERDDSRKVLVIEKNTASIDLDRWSEYSDAVNSNTMWGLGPRKIKLNQWRFDIPYYGTCNAYVANSFEFHINFKTWDFEILNAGFRYLPSGAVRPNYKTIADYTDNQRHQPTPLSEAGAIIDLQTTPGAVYYVNKRVYDEKNFTVLGLPATLPGPFV